MTSICLPKGCKILFAILFFALFQGQNAGAQWTQTKGPGGGDVISLIEKNNTILAATIGGVFRSTDNGDTWAKSWPGNADYATTFAATNNYIYAATYGYGVYRSAYNGATWSVLNMNVGILFILQLYASHDTLYVGTDGGGVYRSVGDATTFVDINTGYPGSAHVTSFAQIGQYLYTGLAGTGGTVGMYRTPVGTITWTQINSGLIMNPSIIDLAVKGTDLLVTTASPFAYGLYRSADLGNTWFNQTPAVLPAAEEPTYIAVSGNDIYVGTSGDAPYKSTNNGVSYQKVDNGLKQLSVFSMLAGSAGVFVGFERGLARTTNGGMSWETKLKGLTNTTITSFLSDGNTLYATAMTGDVGHCSGVYYTTDNGANWSTLDKGLQPNPRATAIIKSGGVLILGTDNAGLYIRTPTDTAFRHPVGLDPTVQIDALLATPQVVLAGVYDSGELYRSTDNGLTWTQSNTGFDAQSDNITALYQKGNAIYAGGFNALYKSTDNGLTWADASTGIYPGAYINAFASIGNDLYAAASTDGVYKSTNGGASWSVINPGASQVLTDLVAYNDTLYGSSLTGAFKSTDFAATWTSIAAGLDPFNPQALSIGIHSNRLFLGTKTTAAWTMALAGQSTAVSSAGYQTGDLLNQNYPNPFSNSTTISFRVPEQAFVSLKVYDVLGREADVLISRVLNAGAHEVRWNSTNFKSGIYYYKLIVGGRTLAKRMQVVK